MMLVLFLYPAQITEKKFGFNIDDKQKAFLKNNVDCCV